ncbi:MAG TPA: hypothetical protein VF263_08220 [Longimicrobiaceae bacterium]
MKLLRMVMIALLLAGTAACATAANGSGSRTNRDVLTAEEIRQAGARDAQEVVERLRPLWLRGRGGRSMGNASTGILVYLNGNRMGGLEALRGISIDMVRSMRYMDGITASAQLPGVGSGHVEGAIVITSTES